MPTDEENKPRVASAEVPSAPDERDDTPYLDFSKEKPTQGEGASPTVGGKYDPRPDEDKARRRIAYGLIALLSVVVCGMLIMIAFGSVAVSELKEFGVVLGPLVTLVSAATGFYYGTKSNSGD